MLTADTYNFATRQFLIYFGLLMLVLGVMGGTFNIIIFRTLKTFRETTCALYLTVLSIVNIAQLFTGLFVRVVSEGFQTGIRKISWVCKLHVYVTGWCLLVLMTIMCLATIDQYISMSAYRRYSNKRLAQRAIVLACGVWSLYCVCLAINWDTSFGVCMVIHLSFAIYMSRFHLSILVGFLPLSIMTIFSLLAFNSARTLVSRQINIVRLSRDRQLTIMTLFHVVYVVITTLPFIIFFIYSLIHTSEDPDQIARTELISIITIVFSYSSYAGSFYIYCCVSERFRKQLLYVLMKVCVYQQQQLIVNWNNNQIAPNVEIIGDAQPENINRLAVEVVSIQ